MIPRMLKALKVLVLTPHIRAYLLANDPQALRQAEEAIAHTEKKLSEMEEASARAARTMAKVGIRI